MAFEDKRSEDESSASITVKLMLRARGATDFKSAGQAALAALPSTGDKLDISFDGRATTIIVEAVFIPPGCEEHCIATVFVAAC